MAILDQLFGLQPQQNPQDTGGLVQSILSQRFQPNMQDVGNSTVQSVIGKMPTPYDAMQQRLAPPLQVAGTLGSLNMTQIALQKMEEEQMRDRMMWGMEMGKLPFGAMPPGVQLPVGFGGGQQPMPPQPNVGFPPPPQQGAMSPDDQRNALNELYPSDTQGGLSSPQGGEIPLTAPSDYTPVKTGFGTPYTQGLPEGQQWATDKNGNQVAIQIPGTVMKGENGTLLTTNPEGPATQTIPRNPQARTQLESNLQQIAQKIDELDKAGGAISEDKGFLSNKATQLAGSQGIKVPFGEGLVLPTGGQDILQGTPETTMRNDIQALVKQTLPLYMQAMGITPGMERAVGAQQMLEEALGGGVDKSVQHLKFSLANLSKQAGTGELAAKLNPKTKSQNGQQGSQIQEGSTATNPANGHQIKFTNGNWIDAKTGAPIQ